MLLVDSSSWIEYRRPRGNRAVQRRVADILSGGQAAWCDMVRLELWNGAGDAAERNFLNLLEETVPLLPIDSQVWQGGIHLAQKARARGITVPAGDLIIVACANHHGVGLEHNDLHLARLLEIC